MSIVPQFENALGLPDELLPQLLQSWTLEYASLKQDGTPITVPLIPFPGEDGKTIDVNTGLAYPTKAERARNNPHVSLLYSEPIGSGVDHPAVILVYGQASVLDADLQSNTDRYIRGFMQRMNALKFAPRLVLSKSIGYLARIWVAVTPLKLLWWPGGDMDQPPREWYAPKGTTAPPGDPKPKPLKTPHKNLVERNPNWRERVVYAVRSLRPPILTVVDNEGYPVPFRTRKASLEDSAVRLELLPSMPVTVGGRACLTFHTLGMSGGTMLSNENLTFIGEVSGDERSALFKVERELPGVDFKSSLKGFLNLIRVIKGFNQRLEVEAQRRGQSVPVIRFPGET